MTCFRPLDAWQMTGRRTEAGKSVITFRSPDGPAVAIKVPCGQCTGCRLAKAREWALRCVHEAQCHEENTFVTLTYRDEDIPENMSLVKEDHQKFMKRLRKRYSGCKMSYYMCGEYGERDERPHYHFLLFGFDFRDKYEWSRSGEYPIYRSPSLDGEGSELPALWPHGFAWIGSVTFESCAYVARYVMKKLNGEMAFDRYVKAVDPETGEVDMIEPEYVAMSRRPPIGARWLSRFKGDCRKDYLTHAGQLYSIPVYYDRCLELEDPDRMRCVKRKRKEVASALAVSSKRLKAIEEVVNARIRRLKRSM